MRNAFAQEHCTSADKAGGRYEHVAIAEGTTTEVDSETRAGAKANFVLRATSGASPIELVATGVSGSGNNQFQPRRSHKTGTLHLGSAVGPDRGEQGTPDIQRQGQRKWSAYPALSTTTVETP
jgi:hypothetical protein